MTVRPPNHSAQYRLVESMNELSTQYGHLERLEESENNRTNEIAADVLDIITACIKLAIKILKPSS